LIEPQAFTSAVASTLNFNATLNLGGLLGSAGVTASVPVSGSETSNGSPGTATFAYTAEFLPNQVSKRVGSTTLGLNTVSLAAGNVNFTQGNGLITSQAVVGATMGSLPQLTTDLDNLVVSRISRLLGLNIGGADVTADWLKCNGQIGAIGLPIPILIK